MILQDTVEILSSRDEVMATLKCHVGQSIKTQLNRDFPGQISVVDTLQLIIKPHFLATNGMIYRWRGAKYTGKTPTVRRRRGRDHHYTIELTRG